MKEGKCLLWKIIQSRQDTAWFPCSLPSGTALWGRYGPEYCITCEEPPDPGDNKRQRGNGSQLWTMDRHDPQLHSGHSLARPRVSYFRAHPKQNGLLSSKPRTGLVGAAQWPGSSSLKGVRLPDLVKSISLCSGSDSFTSGHSQGWKLGSMRVYSVS